MPIRIFIRGKTMNEELIAPCGMNCTICSGFLAVRRKRWKWALAGAIAEALSLLPLGRGVRKTPEVHHLWFLL